jgi:hypothetical protein
LGEQRHPLSRHRLGHCEQQSIAAHSRHERQPDACVTARRLNNRHPRREHAASLGIVDQRDREAILDTPTRIAHLKLGRHPTREILAKLSQLNQRRTPNRCGQIAMQPTSLGLREHSVIVADLADSVYGQAGDSSSPCWTTRPRAHAPDTAP